MQQSSLDGFVKPAEEITAIWTKEGLNRLIQDFLIDANLVSKSPLVSSSLSH